MAETLRYLTVTQLNEYVKTLLDSDALLGGIWVRAEISNFKHHYGTGHFYFSLKDDAALVRAVMFRFNAQKLPFEPKDGMRVLVHGKVSSFVRDGQYQLYVDDMLPDGQGALYFAFEQLKKKLEAAGLFEESRKRPLPRYPESIGIVTSPTGAAIRDMINILGRRYPSASLYLYPALVQGPDAPKQLIEGLSFFANKKQVDVIIIGRGGGSAEDLWAFNNEQLAYAVAASPVPVISAVGHESDFTICDFVADKRAPTPSAAAELAVPDRMELKKNLLLYGNKLSSALLQRLESSRRSLKYLSEAGVLSGADAITRSRRMNLIYLADKADAAILRKTTEKNAELSRLAAKLEALSPLAVMTRGYGIAQTAEGRVIRSVGDVKKEDAVTLRVRDGKIDVKVIETHKERKNGKSNKEL
ncbi:MAG: exodeoxyribonuclease VII large subunit [Ruminococcaceae bacterium]|nr:exodeoxyribonuclease VII large subunit [Oscillospiraceae bacterium]